MAKSRRFPDGVPGGPAKAGTDADPDGGGPAFWTCHMLITRQFVEVNLMRYAKDALAAHRQWAAVADEHKDAARERFTEAVAIALGTGWWPRLTDSHEWRDFRADDPAAADAAAKVAWALAGFDWREVERKAPAWAKRLEKAIAAYDRAAKEGGG